MRFLVGSDHAGIALRGVIVAHLSARGHAVEEIGPAEGERSDYPEPAAVVARAVAVARGVVGDAAAETRGVLICGTGIGMSIAANKIHGVRAALVHDPLTARLAGEHNAANVLCLGARLLAPEYATLCVDTWLDARFEARHQVRIDKIGAIEKAGG